MNNLDLFLAFTWASKELLLIYLLIIFIGLVVVVSIYKFIRSFRSKEKR